MTKMKRLRWIFLSMIACTLLNADTFATERSYIGEKWFQEGDFSFVLLEDGNAAVTAYSGNQSDVVIPNSCANRNVTEIGNLVFEGHNEIVSIEIPDTVVKLGERSIAFCDNLSYINIPESLIEIATEGIYLNDKLQIIDVSISNPVYKVEDSALIDKKKKSLVYYIGCAPEEYVIPDGIKRIEQSFMCNQENLQILIMPDSLRTIGESAFSACDNLTYISFPEGLRYIEDNAFSLCRNLNNISLPNSVIGIGEYAFADCDLVDISLSGELKVLGKGAFLGNLPLQKVEIPGSVSRIGDAVFTFCNTLTEIKISSENNIYEIFNNALYDKMEGRLICYPGGLNSEKYVVTDGTKSIGEWAFISCDNVEEIVIPEGVHEIGDSAMYSCENLRKITIPSTVNDIGKKAFANNKNLENIVVSDNNEYYKTQDGILFDKKGEILVCYPAGKRDIDYEIPEGIKTISETSFYGAGVENVLIPEGVERIGDEAFMFSNTKSATLPASVKYIGEDAFSYMSDEGVLKVPAGSYAEQYAVENDLLYECY